MMLTPDQNEEIDRLVDKLKKWKSRGWAGTQIKDVNDKNKADSQFEHLKASGQLVLIKKDKGDRGNVIWLPRTVAEYKELADTIILQIDRRSPEITRLHEHAKMAFFNAVPLVQWSRRPHNQGECSDPVMLEDGFTLFYVVRHRWIHHCILLWAAIATLDEEYAWPSGYEADTPLGPYADFDWPQHPGTTAFNKAGLSALHAMLSFAELTHHHSFDTFTYAAIEPDDLSFEKAVVEPELCEQVQRWREALVELLSKAVPESDWSDGAVKREQERLLWQLEAEYQEAKKRQESEAANHESKTVKEPSKEANNVFKKTGHFWTVRYQGEDVGSLTGFIGMSYIAKLLAKPHTDISALQLVREVKKITGEKPATSIDQKEANRSDESNRSDEPSASKNDIKPEEANAQMDPEYLREVREERERLDRELATAQEHHDKAEEERIKGKINSLEAIVAASVGLGGRSRKFSDDLEKARDSIRKAVERAKAKIQDEHEGLWRHLDNTVSIGLTCSYKPDHQINWQL